MDVLHRIFRWAICGKSVHHQEAAVEFYRNWLLHSQQSLKEEKKKSLQWSMPTAIMQMQQRFRVLFSSLLCRRLGRKRKKNKKKKVMDRVLTWRRSSVAFGESEARMRRDFRGLLV
jgi:hypothetical protein